MKLQELPKNSKQEEYIHLSTIIRTDHQTKIPVIRHIEPMDLNYINKTNS